MSIANELITDVAVAVLTRSENSASAQTDTRILSVLVLEVYSTLQRLTAEAKDRRRAQQRFAPTPPPAANSKHASSGH